MSNKLSIGILGCSNFAIRSIIPSILQLKNNFILGGIASRNINKADKYSKIFNCNSYKSYDELINDNSLDLVYIPLPNSLHFKWASKALDSDLNVLVEKSISSKEKDVIALVKKAKEKKLVLMENFQFRFHSQLSQIKKLISRNHIGELRAISTSFGFPPFKDKKNIRYQSGLGGGALLDAGAYPIRLTSEFLGHDIKVTAANSFFDKIKGVDTWGGGFIEHNNNSLFSQISFGFDNYYSCKVDLWGSKGKISTNRIFTAPPDLETQILIEKNSKSRILKVKPDNHFINMLKHLYNVINNYELHENECKANLVQARLIGEFKNLL